MTDPDTCPFCDWHAMADPVRINAWAFQLAPLNPVTEGHLLVIPYTHVPDATTDPVLTGHVYRAAAMVTADRGGDWNLITSAGAAATQTVPHLHVHLVPRRPGDGLALPWTGQTRAGDFTDSLERPLYDIAETSKRGLGGGEHPTVGGPWTRHGHVIGGITIHGPGRPPVARCGGPAICTQCSTDAEAERRERDPLLTAEHSMEADYRADLEAKLAAVTAERDAFAVTADLFRTDAEHAKAELARWREGCEHNSARADKAERLADGLRAARDRLDAENQQWRTTAHVQAAQLGGVKAWMEHAQRHYGPSIVTELRFAIDAATPELHGSTHTGPRTGQPAPAPSGTDAGEADSNPQGDAARPGVPTCLPGCEEGPNLSWHHEPGCTYVEDDRRLREGQ